MAAIRESVMALVLFSAAAGCAEMLMESGKAQKCAQAIFGLLALKWILTIVNAALKALPF